MERKLHQLESFPAKGADGADYTVYGYEHMTRDETVTDGIEHWEPTGTFEYRLADGSRINVESDGQMRIASSGVALTAKRAARA